MSRPAVIFFLVFLVLLVNPCWAQNDPTFRLIVHFSPKDSVFHKGELAYRDTFSTAAARDKYLFKLPGDFVSKGFIAASLDSFSTAAATATAWIFLGNQYQRYKISTENLNAEVLSHSGILGHGAANGELGLAELDAAKKQVAAYYANNGYPFAKVFLDSVRFRGGTILGTLRVDSSVLYRMDSIHNYGTANIKKSFLSRYLSIQNGQPYNAALVQKADAKLRGLAFADPVQPSDVSMYGTGAALNVYLNKRKNNVVDFLVGFMPSPGLAQRLMLTGDATLKLENSFGNAESIAVHWQEMQAKSPRLNLSFNQPFLFKSAFGINLRFELFKQDSNYTHLLAQAGTNFFINEKQQGKVFFEVRSSSLLQVDTNAVKALRMLPPAVDFKSSGIGLQYSFSTLNNAAAPKQGWQLVLTSTAGLKNIFRNHDILQIKDALFVQSLYDSVRMKTYQIRSLLSASRYLKAGKFSVWKLGLAAGAYFSGNVFANDLFRIGGAALMRGFNEESIYANAYTVGTVEYRLLMGQVSYLYGFLDVGRAQRQDTYVHTSSTLFGSGVGIALQTKAGLLNLAFAVGKTVGQPLRLGEASKIHFGYMNYF